MGRLKKDHSGWHTSGLYLKYQQPSIAEKPFKGKFKKRDTNKWCRGKVGVDHEWHREQRSRWKWGNNKDYLSHYVDIWCINCKKKSYKRFGSGVLKLPLHISVKVEGKSYPVQVKVDGKAVPISPEWFHDSAHYCEYCREWHPS